MKSILAIFLLLGSVCYATDHCVRAHGGNNGDGTTWSAAGAPGGAGCYTELPAALTRGDTYYIADGADYANYKFDDAVDGTKWIYIKKAIESDHGTDTGWDSSYGDGQAVWIAAVSGYDDDACWHVTTEYYEFDGQVGGGPSDWDGSSTAHGFKLTGPEDNDGTNCMLMGIGLSTNTFGAHYVIKHIEFTCDGYGCASDDDFSDCSGFNPYAIISRGNIRAHSNLDTDVDCLHDVTVSYCYFHKLHMCWNNSACRDWIVEYNHFKTMIDNDSGTPYQEDGMKFLQSRNITIRYNYFYDTSGSGSIFMAPSDQVTNMTAGGFYDEVEPCDAPELSKIYIYGNIFHNENQRSNDVGVVCIEDDRNRDDEVISEIYFYNNTVIAEVEGGNHGINADDCWKHVSPTNLTGLSSTAASDRITGSNGDFTGIEIDDVVKITNTGDGGHVTAGFYQVDATDDTNAAYVEFSTDIDDGNDDTGVTATINFGVGSISDIQVKNNIFYNVNSEVLVIGDADSSFYDNVSSTDVTHNWYDDMILGSSDETAAFVAFGSNHQAGEGDPFINLAGHDYSLTAPTTAGVDVTDPCHTYETDMFGVTRGDDGTWDRGALEYDDSSAAITPMPIIRTLIIMKLLGGGFDG